MDFICPMCGKTAKRGGHCSKCNCSDYLTMENFQKLCGGKTYLQREKEARSRNKVAVPYGPLQALIGKEI